MNITYTIARYELLNNNFLVAFNIISDNNDSAYIESLLSCDEINGKASQEICQIAFDKIKDDVEKIKESFEKNQVSVVGYQFIPKT